jgi:hypothetical protein
MPTFKVCDKSVENLCAELVKKHHEPLADNKVKIDLLFAYGDRDDNDRLLNDALTHQGIRALGICTKLKLKDRVMGRGDVEICLDGDYWPTVSDDQQAALLDHELQHVSIKADKHGNYKFDDIGRPQINLRKHDVEVGWFNVVAERHGNASQEQMQASTIMLAQGQYYWPQFKNPAKLLKTAGDISKTGATKV